MIEVGKTEIPILRATVVLHQMGDVVRFEFGVEFYVLATILANELKYILILDAHICFF